MGTAVLNIKCSNSQLPPPFYVWNMANTASNTNQSITVADVGGAEVMILLTLTLGGAEVNDKAFQIVGFHILN